MKHLKLIEAVVIAGVRHEAHTASDKPLPFDNDAAGSLTEAKLAEEVACDGLERRTLEELAVIVENESVVLSGATRKADIIDAIRAHRAAV